MKIKIDDDYENIEDKGIVHDNTDENIITYESYEVETIENNKKECNNENVYLSTFGINPLIHNPIGIKSCEKLDEVLFAGSYMKRYPHRGEDMEKIFERFYTVDKSRTSKSTGLGLAIVKHIVKLFNGEIFVESEVGKGSKFTVVSKNVYCE